LHVNSTCNGYLWETVEELLVGYSEHESEVIQRAIEKRRLLDIEFLNCSKMECLLKTKCVINQIQTTEHYNYT